MISQVKKEEDKIFDYNYPQRERKDNEEMSKILVGDVSLSLYIFNLYSPTSI